MAEDQGIDAVQVPSSFDDLHNLRAEILDVFVYMMLQSVSLCLIMWARRVCLRVLGVRMQSADRKEASTQWVEESRSSVRG